MRHLLFRRPRLGMTALAVVASLVFVAASAAAPPEIETSSELAFCSGQPVAPIDGVLHLQPGCVLNLHIVWPKGMRGAYLEYSPDGGSTWVKHPLPIYFPVVDSGLAAVAGLTACDLLSSGSYLFRAHGFRSPNERGDLFSAAFPDSVSMACS